MRLNMLFPQIIGALLLLVGPVWSHAQTASLSREEKDMLLFMVEEEKLARDVYRAMENKWGNQVFNHISASEQHHMDMVSNLITSNGLTLPSTVSFDEEGLFNNKQLQKLYDELVVFGSQSLENALRAGAKVEEVDIRDLNKAIDGTENAALLSVYQRLVRASGNHLRAFTRNLKAQGVDYTPVVLSQQEYEAIVAGPAPAETNPASETGAATRECCQGKGKHNGKSCCGSSKN